jgi:hypothetical protein
MSSTRRRWLSGMALALLVPTGPMPVLSPQGPEWGLAQVCHRGGAYACGSVALAKHERFLEGLRRSGVNVESEDVAVEQVFLALLEGEARYGIDHRLLAAVAVAESALNPDALSLKGASGLLQILPGTASVLWPRFVKTLPANDPLLGLDPVKNLHQPRLSVLLGAFYLAELRQQFGDVDLALASYNVGPGTVLKAIKDGETKGTGYIQKIREILRAFKRA